MPFLDGITIFEKKYIEVLALAAAKGCVHGACVPGGWARKNSVQPEPSFACGILAEQRAGTLLKQIDRSKGGGRGKGDKDKNGMRSTLEHMEIPVATAHRWQKMSAVPQATVYVHPSVLPSN